MKNWQRAVAGIGPFVAVIVLIVTNPGPGSLEQKVGRAGALRGRRTAGVLDGVEQGAFEGEVRCENFGMFSVADVLQDGRPERHYLGILGLWIALDHQRPASESHADTGLPAPRQQ